MGIVAKPNTISDGDAFVAAPVDDNFDAIFDLVNGGLDNDNIKAAAVIVESKLLFANSGGHTHTGASNKGTKISLTDLADLLAANLPNTPAGNIAATNVQAAIDELDDEKLSNAADAVTHDKIKDGAVWHLTLADDAVSGSKIANLAVVEAKIGAAAVTEAKLQGSAVAQAKLKTTLAEVSFSISGDTEETNEFTPTTTYVTATPQSKWGTAPGGASWIMVCWIGSCDTETSYLGMWCQTAFNDNLIAKTAYTRYRYVQSSPPYEIEHFIYALLNADDSIKGLWEAEDPPWQGHGFDGDATEKDISHPFRSMKPGQKVILVNPNINLMNELIDKRKSRRKSYLELINGGDYVIGDKLWKPRGKMTERIIAKGVEFRRLINV